MIVTHKINIDLTRGGIIPGIKATQGDANTRQLEITLQTDTAEWAVPEGTNISVAFRNLRDGHKGWYDQLPDGTAACSFNGNVVTAILAPAVLSSAGDVNVAVVLQDASLNQLATFGVTVTVEPNPAAGTSISNDYYRYTSMEAIDEAVDTWLTETEAEKNDFLAKAEDALTTIREAVTTGENAPAIVSDVTGECIAVSDASDRLLHGLVLYGKTTQNGTPSPDAPVELVSAGSGGSVEVNVCGKNLLPSMSAATTKVINGVTFTVNGDGSVTANGTATSDANFPIFGKTWDDISNVLRFDTDERYILSSGTANAIVYCRDAVNNRNYTTPLLLPATLENVACLTYAFIQVKAGRSINNETIYPMIRLASVDDDTYELGKNHQILAAFTPNGLPGIPVTYGGTYTDERGQQWISDEIDLARGVYVQRVGKKVITGDMLSYSGTTDSGFPHYSLYNTSNLGIKDYKEQSGHHPYALCDKYPVIGMNSRYKDGTLFMNTAGSVVICDSNFASVEEVRARFNSDPITLIYACTPKETPLSAEELAAFAAIHSNYPNTTVHNDAGAGMKVGYVADTKRYIDNKFAALSAAIVNNA